MAYVPEAQSKVLLFYLVSLGTLTDPVERDFVSWLLHKNIDDRPSAEEALTHPYLKSIDDQFNFLVEMGNEPEIKGNTHCYVVEKLNNIQHKTRKDYPNGWKAKIQPSQVNCLLQHILWYLNCI
jgi:serine/threonine protein kinase